MSASAPERRVSFGTGPLARISATVYTLIVIEAMFVLASAPGLLLLGMVDRDASEVPLVALCALPLGPAWSAAVYAWNRRSTDLTDLRPAAAFRCGYRANLADVLRLWVPWLVFAALVGTILAHGGEAGVPGWWVGLLAVLGAVSLLWLGNALLLASLFSFRARDTARLAAYCMVRHLRATAVHLCLLAAAVALTTASVLLTLVCVSVFAALSSLGGRAMTADVQQRFTA